MDGSCGLLDLHEWFLYAPYISSPSILSVHVPSTFGVASPSVVILRLTLASDTQSSVRLPVSTVDAGTHPRHGIYRNPGAAGTDDELHVHQHSVSAGAFCHDGHQSFLPRWYRDCVAAASRAGCGAPVSVLDQDLAGDRWRPQLARDSCLYHYACEWDRPRTAATSSWGQGA